MSCTGKCCSRFYMPIKGEALAKIPMINGTVEEANFIKDMVIFIEDYPIVDGVEDPGAYYTCRHWDTQTRLCKAYEQRPSMCKDFPYGDQCPHESNCTELGKVDFWKDKRKKLNQIR